MKKIILSLAMIAAMAALAVGATTAYFSDTETSEGNTFTAGAIDLKIDSNCSYNGVSSDECGVWDETDLGATNYKFFNFSDLKPGDQGENTISYHVYNNDAYMCVYITDMHDDDLGLTEPEQEDGDYTDGADNGELAQELHFFAWADDGDNIWECGEDTLFSNIEGPASDILDGRVYPLYTPNTGALSGDSTGYIGIYWCYGNLIVNQQNCTLSCDGSAVNNVSQTDSLTANISFYAEQARHNENFTCPSIK